MKRKGVFSLHQNAKIDNLKSRSCAASELQNAATVAARNDAREPM